MADDLTMPQPEVDNLRKASTEQLVQEVITLRLFTAQLLVKVNNVLSGYQLPDEVNNRLAVVENLTAESELKLKGVHRLADRLNELERKMATNGQGANRS